MTKNRKLPETRDVVSLLRSQAETMPDRVVFTFLENGEQPRDQLTFAALDARARAVAFMLSRRYAAGERALLLYPPGLEFITAFFGCLYAGILAVPAYPPKANHKLTRLHAIMNDAGTNLALTTASLLRNARRWQADQADAPKLELVATDMLPPIDSGAFQPRIPEPSDLAFLQYTSGSTGDPKGVMVSHWNLICNSRDLAAGETGDDAVMVTWLPTFHDMGLIYGVLQPVYRGFPCYMMAPNAFLQRPVRWLQAVTRFGGTHSAAPDFADDLCVRTISEAERAKLDLSSWRVALNGAEPIRAHTIHRFLAAFSGAGLRPQTICPGYGLAEATLKVTASVQSEPPVFLPVDRDALARHRVVVVQPESPACQELVGCGSSFIGSETAIVDPDTCLPCEPDTIGEIWVAGETVAQGYWRRAADTQFRARFEQSDGDAYLRTGDLGFIHDGQLYITGRIKDMIIVRGRNHYPMDLEQTALAAHPALRPNGGAAFALDQGDGEKLVLCLEVERTALRNLDADAVIASVRDAVAAQHELGVYAVVLIKPASLPKTSSGKIQRRTCRTMYLENSLKVAAVSVHDWAESVDMVLSPDRETLLGMSDDQRNETVRDYLRAVAAAELGIAPDRWAWNQPLTSLGLDSLAAVTICHRLTREIGLAWGMTRLLENNSLAALTQAAVIGILNAAKVVQDATALESTGESGQSRFPLSHNQRGLWFLHRLAPTGAAYHVCFAVRLDRGTDAVSLKRAFAAVFTKHGAMRTTYHMEAGEPYQTIHDQVPDHWREIDTSTWEAARFNRLLSDECERPFDLEHGPVMDALYAKRDTDAVLLVRAHHIAVDMWSMGVFLRDLGEAYTSYLRHDPLPPETPPRHYGDFALKQTTTLDPDGPAWLFWRERLAGLPPTLKLPLDFPRPEQPDYRGGVVSFSLDLPTSAGLRHLSGQVGATMSTTLLSAFQILLHGYSGQTDLAVGVPTAGRNDASFQETMGYFVNPMVARADFRTDESLPHFLERMRDVNLATLAHADYPLQLLVARLQPERAAERMPLFHVMFAYQRAHDAAALTPFALGASGAQLRLGDLRLESLALPQQTAQFDLELTAIEWENRIHASLNYTTALFHPATASKMVTDLQNLLRAMAVEPNRRIAELLQEAGIQQVLSLDQEPESATVQIETDPILQPANPQLFHHLADIWRGLLEVPSVQPSDHFFHLGGHSLTLMRLQARLEQDFGVEVPLIDFFRLPTLETQAARLTQLIGNQTPEKAAEAFRPPIIPRQGPLPLSFAQTRLWFLDQLDGGGPAYNEHAAFRISGPLDVPLLRRCFSQCARRHESLRTTFHERGGSPEARIHGEPRITIRLIDFSGLPFESAHRRQLDLLRVEIPSPFNLHLGPLWRVTLFRFKPDEHLLAMTMHHIISDAWSGAVLLGELTDGYHAGLTGKSLELPELPFQYADFAAWQRDQWQTVGDGQLVWWRAYLEGAPALLTLPTDKPRPASGCVLGGSSTFSLTAGLNLQIERFAQQHGVTSFMLLITAYALLLKRYSGQTEVVVGVPAAGRYKPELEHLIGFFVNTLPVRLKASDQLSITAMLERTLASCTAVFAHQETPFELLVQELQPERDTGAAPIFQTMFAMENAPMNAFKLHGSRVSPEPPPITSAKYDLVLFVEPGDGGLVCRLDYAHDLFHSNPVARMAGHYRNLVTALVGGTASRLGDLTMMGEAERERLLSDWSGTTHHVTQMAVHQCFEVFAVLQSDAVLLTEPHTSGRDFQLTYRALNNRADGLAHLLRSRGVGPETLVGIYLPREANLLIAMLAVLKAGGAYVPLDPVYPSGRIARILGNACAPLVITRTAMAENLPEHGGENLCLETVAAEAEPTSNGNPFVDVPPDHLAYVLYTSGSTGEPKGVAIRHQGPTALTAWAAGRYSSTELAAVAAVTSICFDLSVFELLVPPALGGGVVLFKDALALENMPAVGELSLINTVPSAMESLFRLNALPRRPFSLNLAGEPIPRHLMRRIGATPTIRAAYNLYGPSEDTTYSTERRLGDWSTVPDIGRPLPNTRALILDDCFHLAAVGVAGELCLSGSGLARGYQAKPDLTAASFVPHPHPNTGGERIYRTGDLVRRLDDGHLVFLGRMDFQVKTRGFRVELGEIEVALTNQPAVARSLVTLYPITREEQILTAYVCPSDAFDGSAETLAALLRGHLAEKLPAYMVPAAIVMLQAFPLTPNGKVDRTRLPAPDQAFPANSRAPRDAEEKALAAIWCELLGREPGVHDNFFRLGGHSLLVTRFVAAVRDRLGVQLSVRGVFDGPTVAEQADRVRALLNDPGSQSETQPTAMPDDVQPPLSFAQERMWFLNRLEGPNPTYNMTAALRLNGRLDRGALATALNEIVARHQVLRTRFLEVRGQVGQRIMDHTLFHPTMIALDGVEGEGVAGDLLKRECLRVIDLNRDPLFYVHVLTLEPTRHLLVLTFHHIISDGWSMGVFMQALRTAYQAALEKRPCPLERPAIQYGDYARWQRRHLRGAALVAQTEYWKRVLSGAPDLLELPTDHPRPAIQDHRGDMTAFAINPELGGRLRAYCERAAVTPFAVLLSCFLLMLQRYSRQNDVVVGAPVAGRNHGWSEGLIGLFVNTLAIRHQFSEGCSFEELAAKVSQATREAFNRQDVPFERLVAQLRPARNLSYSPIFQVMFAMQDLPRSEGLPGLQQEVIDMPSPAAKFDLTLYAEARDGGYACSMEYAKALFERDTIERWCGHLAVLLEAALHSPDAPLECLNMLGREEQARLLVEWNQSACDFGPFQAIHLEIAAFARNTPEAVAVSWSDDLDGVSTLTYAELMRRVDDAAAHLRGLGVERERITAILAERDPLYLTAMLAVLKLGAVYLPLDPSQPAARLAHIIRGAKPHLLLNGPGFEQKARDAADGEKVLLHEIDRLLEPLPARRGLHPPAQQRIYPNSLAYMIYTSGSTGLPKGAMVAHQGMRNHLYTKIVELGLNARDTISQNAPQSFDISVWQFLAGLLVGGRTHIFSSAVAANPVLLIQGVAQHGVHILEVVPALMHMLLDAVDDTHAPDRLRYLIPTGEALPPELARVWLARYPRIPLLNAYGPTECSDDVTHHVITEPPQNTVRNMPIGRPVANMRMYVTDAGGRPAPLGVPGELRIGGIGVGWGYFGDPIKTACSFVPDPFGGEIGGRLYRTADLVRYQKDGALVFLGRTDHQIKLRGFRIELGEIEAVLATHPGLTQTAVLLREDQPGKPYLAAYYAFEGVTAPDVDVLRAFLRKRLPDYMVPTAFQVMAPMPLTPNGKIDRRGLPKPLAPQDETAAAEMTPEEALMAAVWANLLDLQGVGRDANFFEIGGHSLLATSLLSRVRTTFGAALTPRTLFEAPTVSQFTAAVLAARHSGESFPPLEPAPRDKNPPLSFAQRRLWFLDQFEGPGSAYNMPSAHKIEGRLDVGALFAALTAIVARHEAVRTSFQQRDGEAVQAVAPPECFVPGFADLSRLPTVEQERLALDLARRETERPFDLRRAPMIRVTLLRLAPARHVLLATMHHIASDGWSLGVLIRELRELYLTDHKPEPLPIQYADFAQWQQTLLNNGFLNGQLDYWRTQLADAPPLLEMPLDRPRPAIQTYRGRTLAFQLSASLTKQLNNLALARGVTPFMLLLAAYACLLARYSRQDDVLIGTPIANRTRPELESLIGFFVNTLVARVRLAPKDAVGPPLFTELLDQVRGTALDAFANQDIPFELLVDKLCPQRDTRYSPLFQIMFIMQNAAIGAVTLPGVRFEQLAVEHQTARFDMVLSMTPEGDRLVGALEYNIDLFDEASMIRFMGHYQRLLQGVADSPGRSVYAYELMDESERDLVLTQWNQTQAELPPALLAHGLFESRAARFPDRIAVTFEDGTLTYAQLNRAAERLAAVLCDCGVGPERFVGLCLPRGIDLAVAVLAVLKSGGAYVPFDLTFPEARLRHMLQDARPAAVLIDDPELLAWVDVPRLNPRDYRSRQTATLLDVTAPLDSSSPVYMLYTSGSTGQPKGAVMPHAAVVNLIAGGPSSPERLPTPMLQFAAISFDMSFLEMFTAWWAGDSLALVSEALRLDLEALAAFVARCYIGTAMLPVVVLQHWAELAANDRFQPRALHTVITAGERLRISHEIAGLFQTLPDARLYNYYGPTETHLASVYALTGAPETWPKLPPIGRPISNARLYVVDGFGQAVPRGVAGELWIAGAGLARCYHQRPELTAQRFVPDPFSGLVGARAYRSGDLARYLPDGDLVYLDRIDQQVKIRGFRVELGEIESTLAGHPEIRQAVVIVRQRANGDAYLAAYLVSEGDVNLDQARDYVGRVLPAYAVPATFTRLDQLPLTVNGKLNIQALPEPAQLADGGKDHVPARDAAEAVIAGIWAELLDLPGVGVHDNFFHLGGSSLVATRVVSRIRQDLDLELPVREMFSSPTVAGIANVLAESVGDRETLNIIAETAQELASLSEDEINALL